jgi:hypothetical protein
VVAPIRDVNIAVAVAVAGFAVISNLQRITKVAIVASFTVRSGITSGTSFAEIFYTRRDRDF